MVTSVMSATSYGIRLFVNFGLELIYQTLAIAMVGELELEFELELERLANVPGCIGRCFCRGR